MAKKLNIGAIARWTGTPILTFVNGTPESIDLAQWVYNPRGFNLTYTVASGSLGEVTLVGSVVSFDGSGPQSSTPVSFNISDGSRTKESPQTSVVILNQPVVEPAVPVNVQADGLTQDTIRVIWTPGVGGPTPTSFPVYRSTTQNGTYAQIAEPASSPYDDGGYAPETTRWYKVSAKADGIESAQSTADAGTTLAEPSQDDWPTQTPSYIPIVPNAAGFGMNQLAGHAGLSSRGDVTPTIMIVNSTSTANSGSFDSGTGVGQGTFTWCLSHSQSGHVPGTNPRLVIPGVSGVINYTPRTVIQIQGRTTLAMQAAPSPGLYTTGATLEIRGSNVLLWHAGAFWPDNTNTNRDGISTGFSGPFSNIVYANCSAMWSTDENFGLGTSPDIFGFTMWQCLASEPLIVHGTEADSYNMLINSSVRTALITRCAFLHGQYRNPLTRGNNATYADNLIYDWGESGIDITNGDSTFGDTNVRSNLLNNILAYGPEPIAGKWPQPWEGGATIYFRNAAIDIRSQNASFVLQYYSSGNVLLYTHAITAPLLDTTSNVTNAGALISSAYPQGFVTEAYADAEDHGLKILSTAGPRPGDRLATIARTIATAAAKLNGASTGLGEWVGAPSQVGGLPVVSSTAVDHIAQGLPTGAAARAIQGNGRTALENWVIGKHDAVM